VADKAHLCTARGLLSAGILAQLNQWFAHIPALQPADKGAGRVFETMRQRLTVTHAPPGPANLPSRLYPAGNTLDAAPSVGVHWEQRNAMSILSPSRRTSKIKGRFIDLAPEKRTP
jgi:hypothetical protein